jgi:hypothetical protein
VSEEDEKVGLDVSQHDEFLVEAYLFDYSTPKNITT